MLKLTVFVCGLTLSAAACAGDWTSWRGPQQNGVSRESGLPTRISLEGGNLVWKTHEVVGRNTPIVMGGRVFLLTIDGIGERERERIVCMNADTGKLVWQYNVNVFHSTIPNMRVGWSSVVGDAQTGYIYSHTTGGIMLCLDRDGRLIWSRSLTEEFNRISGYGGRLMTPIVDGELVIVSFLNTSWGALAGPSHRYVAFDKRSGEVVWWSKPGGRPLDTTYAVPVVAVINGRRQLIGGAADGTVFGLKIATGEPVWSFKLSKRGLNVSPVVHGNHVYIAHSEENIDNTAMGRVVCVDASGKGDVTKTHEVWRVDGLKVGYASPLLHDGRLYVIENRGTMHCLDAATGAEHWRFKIGRVAKGSPVWADGRIYITEVNERFLILQPSDKSCALLSETKFEDPAGAMVDLFGSPAVSNGRLFFTTMNGVYCIGSKEARPSDTVSGVEKPRPAAPGAKAAHLAVYPADVLLKPGERKKLTARAFDADGRFIKEVAASWSSDEIPASVSDSGELTVNAQSGGFVGNVKAEFGALSASARLRVVPAIPYREDFASVPVGKTPPQWIGAVPKFVVDQIAGERVLKKKADNPKLRRGNIYMGTPEMSGYTIQADVLGAKSGRDLPDMGLIVHRYRFEVMGNTQKLRIVSWVPKPRIEKAIPFEWDAGQWFTMKFRVDLHDAGGTIHGKIWPRGAAEPSEWTLTLEDPIAHRRGAPGLYGYSPAEIYYDNVMVRPNE